MSTAWKKAAVSVLVATATYPVAAQQPIEPTIRTNMIYFDETVPLKNFHRLVVYRAWGDANIFYILPSDIQQSSQNQVSLQYEIKGADIKGMLHLTMLPSFDQKEFAEVVSEIKQQYPSATFSIAEPESSEWEIEGFGIKKGVTPPLMSNPLLSTTSATLEIPSLLSRTLLHSGSHYASAFVVRHDFSIRGVQVDNQMKPRVATRWFSRGVSFPGGCGVAPERYLNLKTGQTGCVFSVTSSREDILEVQTLLRQLGYYASAIDGVLGPQTRLSIKRFQAKFDRLQDGNISSGLLSALRDELAKSASKAPAQSSALPINPAP